MKHVSREYYMTDSFHLLWHQKLNEEERSQVGQMLEFYVEQFERLLKKHKHNQMGLAAGIHTAVEQAIAQHKQATPDQAAQIRCQKGCSYCCSTNVDIIAPESILLTRYAREKGLTIDYDRLARQNGKGPETWSELSEQDRRCVFLQDDGTCGVYEHRPLSCRKYFVISEPILCSLQGEGDGAWRYIAPLAEIITTAALTVFGANTMAPLLLAVRDKEKSS